MSESRFEHIERSIEQQGAKIDRLIEVVAAQTEVNKRINQQSERLDRFETRLIKAEKCQAQHQASRESWSFMLTRVLPVSLTVLGVFVAYIMVRIKGGM